MKLSLSWILDHIDVEKKKIDIHAVLDTFSKTTAEIERVQSVSLELDRLTVAQVTVVTDTYIELFSPELHKALELPLRDVVIGQWYLLQLFDGVWHWATSTMVGAEKEFLLPALSIAAHDEQGAWKKSIEKDDLIIEVSNITLTNRPDMWSHRGFAREFAVLLDKPLKKIDQFLEPLTVQETTKDFIKDDVLEIQIRDSKKCKRLAALKINNIENKDSFLPIALRLTRVDSRPINAIVDATNYTMLDIGQPMHAFDAAAFQGRLIARAAQAGETLTLLDGQTVTLQEEDCVIANDTMPVSLAGIMGGRESGVQSSTQALVVEAACFEPGTIRRTSARVKLRSEASSRYEKSLDPNQIVDAIKRFVRLLREYAVSCDVVEPILAIGQKEEERTIIIEHEFIVDRLGVSLEQEYVADILKSLGFGVIVDESTYKIVVPSYRATKDIVLPEDILEEIIRFYGYEKIPFVLPVKETKPHALDSVLRERVLKNYMAFGASMMEVNNYPFYDEHFIAQLNYTPKPLPQALSPVSQHWKQLVGSLVPHLFKGITTNLHRADSLRFFELNRVWDTDGEKVVERKSLAALAFSYKGAVDFYYEKSLVQDLFLTCGITDVQWKKASPDEPWFDPYATADIYVHDQHVGRAGLVNALFLERCSEQGNAFVVELNATWIIEHVSLRTVYKPISKFQPIVLDVSMFVPLSVTFDVLKETIMKAHPSIQAVELVDVFEKPEWLTKKSYTLRYHVIEHTKTLTKDEIDIIAQRVHAVVIEQGAEIR